MHSQQPGVEQHQNACPSNRSRRGLPEVCSCAFRCLTLPHVRSDRLLRWCAAPGAAYLMDSTLSSVGASLKFRHEKRALQEAMSPGPGEYAATGADRPQPPAFTFGVSRK